MSSLQYIISSTTYVLSTFLPTFASYSSSLVFFHSLIACFHSWMIYSVRYVASRFFFLASCLYPNPRLNSVRVRAPLVLSNPSINSVRQESGITAGGTHKKQIYEIHKYKRCILVQCTCLVYRDTKIMRSCSTHIKLRAGINSITIWPASASALLSWLGLCVSSYPVF